MSDTPITDALRDSFGGDCCGEANKALLLAAEFEKDLKAAHDILRQHYNALDVCKYPELARAGTVYFSEFRKKEKQYGYAKETATSTEGKGHAEQSDTD